MAALLAVILLLSTLPLTAMAAPASDIPEEMLNNVYLDALEYTGYKVQSQKNDGTIFKVYGSRLEGSSVLSGITYDNSFVCTGLETIPAGTPDIAKFRQHGLCCASYTSYVYFNYLPNVAGVDTSSLVRPSNYKSAGSWNTAANGWVSSGDARRISFSQNADGSGFSVSESVPLGSLIVFKSISNGGIAHVALYAGYYNGHHFVTHVGNDRGPEISTIDGMSKGGYPEAVAQIVVPNGFSDDGAIEIHKKDPNGKNLNGAIFVATNKISGQQFQIGPTNSEGYAYKDKIPYSDYRVVETVFPKDYTAYGQTEWDVTVDKNNNGVVTINAVNEIIPGVCKIIKTSEDGEVAGKKFNVSGNGVNKDCTTNTDGMITESLTPGTYTVTEYAEDKYVQPKSQTVTIVSGQTASVQFSNILKKWNLTALKQDGETKIPQGDATLANAEYGIFKDGELVDSYFTDEYGKFTTKTYTCGSGWELKEIKPSVGYMLNSDIISLGTEAKNYTAEINPIDETVTEQVIKGTVSIIKHTDGGSTQIETPEAGAEFELYLKAAGSYAAAKESERDILVCDEHGYDISKELPYGEYIVHQTKGWKGKEFIGDFTVFISENGKTYPFLINNATFESFVKVVKVDSETDKTIPCANTGFRLYNPDGSLVTMTMTYPTPVTIDTFYTNNEGYLITPQVLPYGTGYALEEVQAPYGYVLDSEKQYFDITADNATEENAVTVVVVNKPDMPQKGIISINKSGEVFASVTATAGIYQPIYKVQG